MVFDAFVQGGADEAEKFFCNKGKPVHSVCRIERVNGSFSLRLNDYNRVTTVTRDSPADKSKLKPFDRILKVDGSALDGRKLSEVAAGKDAMLLDVERPPTSAYKVIFDHENQSERGPYLFDEGPSSGRPSGTVDEIPDAALEKLSGEETLHCWRTPDWLKSRGSPLWYLDQSKF